MTTDRALYLMWIEHECVTRAGDEKCDRNCAKCDLLQDTGELLSAYEYVIRILSERC